MIDHRELLKKYMMIVGEAEGIDFADYPCPVEISDKERAELLRLSKESINEWVDSER